LPSLARRAWELLDEAHAQQETPVVRPSAPILYFGDYEAYARSPIRVVTVGVNPSFEEFPERAPWSRFDCADLTADKRGLESYLGVLNEYFERDPYKRWFDRSYQPALEGFGASYYSGSECTAVHTDVCSPLATRPTWGGLKPWEREPLLLDGVRIWHELAEVLRPKVIFASVSAIHRARIALERVSQPEVIHSVAQARPCEIWASRVRCGDSTVVLVWGGAATHPFQLIDHGEKRRVGEIVRGLVDG